MAQQPHELSTPVLYTQIFARPIGFVRPTLSKYRQSVAMLGVALEVEQIEAALPF